MLFHEKVVFFFSICKDTDYSYISSHIARCKNTDRKKFCPISQIFKNSFKILFLMETNGSDVEYENQFCPQCFSGGGVN